MAIRTFSDAVSRLRYRVGTYLSIYESNGGDQSHRIRLNQLKSSIRSLVTEINRYLVSGIILEVKYIANGNTYKGTFVNISKKDFKEFIKVVNLFSGQEEIKILEFREIKTRIEKIPLYDLNGN